jgi:hypothetical protein
VPDDVWASFDRADAIEQERAARAELMDTSQELTTEMLERYDRAKAHREQLGIPEAAVGSWEQERGRWER